MFPIQRSTLHAPRPPFNPQPHCRNNATATRTLRASKTPNSKLFCDQRHAIKRKLLRTWNANCGTAEQSQNRMISHLHLKQDHSVANYRRAPQTLDVQWSMFDVQWSRFPVELLPQKNAKHAKDAAGIALPGSLSSLRSFAAHVPVPEDGRAPGTWKLEVGCWMLDVPGSQLNAQRSTLNAQRSTFNVQGSTFNVQRLPQKNAKDAAGIALPGSLSSLRSFAAIVSPATPNLRSTHHAPRTTLHRIISFSAKS